MDFLMTVTMPRLGTPDEVDAVLRAFESRPEANPVVVEDLAAQTLDVTFLVSVGTADEALTEGRQAVASTLDGSDEDHRVLSVQVEPA
jgi:hypothetical protein